MMHTPVFGEFLFLALLAALLSGKLWSADETVKPAESSLATELQGALTAQGWTGTQRDDGSIDYRQSPLPEQNPPPGMLAPEQSPAAQLREQLTLRGWTAMPADDGSVMYRMPARSKPNTTGLADELQAQLQAQGWVSSVGPDGNAIYHRPMSPEDAVAVTPSKRPPVLAEQLRRQFEALGWTASPAPGGGVYYRKPKPQLYVAPTLADDLRGQLVQQGWVGTVTADGSVIYRFWRSVDRPANASSGETPAQQLRRALEAMGWTASPGDDGGVMYLPPTDSVDPGLPSSPPPQPEEPPTAPVGSEQSRASGGKAPHLSARTPEVKGERLRAAAVVDTASQAPERQQPLGLQVTVDADSVRLPGRQAGATAIGDRAPDAATGLATDRGVSGPTLFRRPGEARPQGSGQADPYTTRYRPQQPAYGRRWPPPSASHPYRLGNHRQPMPQQPPPGAWGSAPWSFPPSATYRYR